MTHSSKDRALALAGIIQACYLVDQVARRGIADSGPMEATLESLFQFDPDDVATTYGGIGNLLTGLRQLRDLLTSPTRRDTQLARYVVTVVNLERKLAKRGDMLSEIRERLGRTVEQVEHFSLLHGNVLANLADIYVSTISNLRPRVMVNGEPGYLSSPDNVNRIRALLLAAIRSAVLWRQCGGNRLQILLGRKKLLAETEQLISQCLH